MLDGLAKTFTGIEIGAIQVAAQVILGIVTPPDRQSHHMYGVSAPNLVLLLPSSVHVQGHLGGCKFRRQKTVRPTVYNGQHHWLPSLGIAPEADLQRCIWPWPCTQLAW